MKKKWIIAISVFGMVVTGSTGVYAGANLEQIKAYLNHSLGIEVDGSPYVLKDGNGKKLAPITYGGLTYLPVRAVSAALNIPITYDSVSYKVKIGKPPVILRSQYLPSDFPIPSDAILTKSVDSVVNGVKNVSLVYSTQETLDIMGFVYKEYVKIKGIGVSSQNVSPTSIFITGQLGGTSPLTIRGKASATKVGFNEFTITWSEY